MHISKKIALTLSGVAATATLIMGCVSSDSSAANSSVKDASFSDNPRVQKALDYLEKADISKLSSFSGSREICEGVTLSVAENDLREVSAARLEAHKKFIDLQFVIEGEETFGLKPVSECRYLEKAYDEARDVEFFFDSFEIFETLKAGEFIILSPEWAHAPCLGRGKVKKGVFKIKVD